MIIETRLTGDVAFVAWTLLLSQGSRLNEVVFFVILLKDIIKTSHNCDTLCAREKVFLNLT